MIFRRKTVQPRSLPPPLLPPTVPWVNRLGNWCVGWKCNYSRKWTRDVGRRWDQSVVSGSGVSACSGEKAKVRPGPSLHPSTWGWQCWGWLRLGPTLDQKRDRLWTHSKLGACGPRLSIKAVCFPVNTHTPSHTFSFSQMDTLKSRTLRILLSRGDYTHVGASCPTHSQAPCTPVLCCVNPALSWFQVLVQKETNLVKEIVFCFYPLQSRGFCSVDVFSV